MKFRVPELAEKLGISRQAVNQAVLAGKLVRDSGFGLIDMDKQINRDWYEPRWQKAQELMNLPDTMNVEMLDPEKALEEISASDLKRLPKSEIDKLKAMEQMLKAQIDRKIKRKELIPRALVQSVFGVLYTIDANELKTLGSKVSAEVAGICGTDDPEAVLLVEKRIEQEVTKILAHIKQILDDSLASWEPK